MSDFDQQHADGARRDGYSSSNGGHNGGRNPRQRFTRNNGGERASYGNRGTNENGRNGGYDRQSGYNNNNNSPRQGGYNRTGGYERQGGFRQNSGNYDRSGGGYRRPSEGFRRPAGGYRQQEGNENGGYQGGTNRVAAATHLVHASWTATMPATTATAADIAMVTAVVPKGEGTAADRKMAVSANLTPSVSTRASNA